MVGELKFADNIIQVYINLKELDYTNSINLYLQTEGQISNQSCPKRILIAVADIVKKSKENFESLEETKMDMVLNEILKINKKIESLEQMLHFYDDGVSKM